jgi:hypothetical protein
MLPGNDSSCHPVLLDRSTPSSGELSCRRGGHLNRWGQWRLFPEAGEPRSLVMRRLRGSPTTLMGGHQVAKVHGVEHTLIGRQRQRRTSVRPSSLSFRLRRSPLPISQNQVGSRSVDLQMIELNDIYIYTPHFPTNNRKEREETASGSSRFHQGLLSILFSLAEIWWGSGELRNK